MLTVSQVAEQAQVSITTVRRAILSGELEAFHIGRRVRIDPEERA